MANTATPLPRFTETEREALNERASAATSALLEVQRQHTAATKPQLLVSLSELFSENPGLRRVYFEPTTAYDDNDWFPSITVGVDFDENDADELSVSQIEEEWEELAWPWHPTELEEMLPERSLTREQLTTALLELKRTLSTTGRADG
jgi:hypothetical protein